MRCVAAAPVAQRVIKEVGWRSMMGQMGWVVSHTIIAGTWVAFCQGCQQRSCVRAGGGAFWGDHAPRLHDGDGRRAGGGSGVPREAAAGLDGQVAAVAEPVAVASMHTIVALGSASLYANEATVCT